MRTSILASAAIFMAACGGDGGNGPGAEFTVEVTPATASLFSVAPGNSVTLSVVARDGSGAVMSGGTPTFATGNAAVAIVGNSGVVTAVAPGTAQITASLTLDGATETASTTVTVEEAAAAATVVAPAFSFNPGTVDVKAGGSVTWTIDAIHHTVQFTTAGAPEDVPEVINASVSRIFAANGAYSYRCSIHPAMTGVVRVH